MRVVFMGTPDIAGHLPGKDPGRRLRCGGRLHPAGPAQEPGHEADRLPGENSGPGPQYSRVPAGKFPGGRRRGGSAGLAAGRGRRGGLWPHPAPAGIRHSRQGLHQYSCQSAAGIPWLGSLSVGGAGGQAGDRRNGHVSGPGNGCRRHDRSGPDPHRSGGDRPGNCWTGWRCWVQTCCPGLCGKSKPGP